MNRRIFIGNCAVGLPVAVGCCGAAAAALGAEPESMTPIDADQLVELAMKHFVAGRRTCCESILMAGCEVLGIESDLVPEIALGLAGGVGLQGETCGVLTSSALVLSLAVAQREKEYAKRKPLTMQAVSRVHATFKEQFQRTACRSLSGVDLTTPEGRKEFEASVRMGKCAGYVKAAATILAEELKKVYLMRQ